MGAKGTYNDPSKAKLYLQEAINEEEAKENWPRVEQLKQLNNALDSSRINLNMQEAQDYISLFGYSVKTRLSFYKVSEINHSIPYEDLNPTGKNGSRLFDKGVLDLFIKNRGAFENTIGEARFLEELKSSNRIEFREKSRKLGNQKLKRLKDELESQPASGA